LQYEKGESYPGAHGKELNEGSGGCEGNFSGRGKNVPKEKLLPYWVSHSQHPLASTQRRENKTDDACRREDRERSESNQTQHSSAGRSEISSRKSNWKKAKREEVDMDQGNGPDENVWRGLVRAGKKNSKKECQYIFSIGRGGYPTSKHRRRTGKSPGNSGSVIQKFFSSSGSEPKGG